MVLNRELCNTSSLHPSIEVSCRATPVIWFQEILVAFPLSSIYLKIIIPISIKLS